MRYYDGRAATKAVAVTPDDGTDLPFVTTSVYVAGTGDLVVILAEDTDPVTFTDVPSGTVLRMCVKRVMEATDATGVVALA
jgi:hypothetical protein